MLLKCFPSEDALVCKSIRLCLLALTLTGAPVLGADFARDSIPGKWIQPLVPEDLPPLKYPVYFTDFEKARQQVWTGRYKLALQSLYSIKPTDKGSTPASYASLRAEALVAIGREDEALAVLSDPAVVDAPVVQIDRAVLLADLGRTSEAVALLKEHLRAHPDSLRAHYELGRLSERVDDFVTARDAYGWFVAPGRDFITQWQTKGERIFAHADDATYVGLALDRWATLNGQYEILPNLNQTLLDFFVKSYDVIDRQYWPAHVAAARFYLSHDDATNAQQELKAALGANPNSAKALDLMGQIAVDHYDFNTADAVVDALRGENPNSMTADLLEARNLLRERQPKEAAVVVNRVLARQPNLIEAKALLAATEALQLHDDATKQLLADVDKAAPNDASAYFEVAEQLAAMRQYPRSAAMYKVAIERAPWWSNARNGLGLLYTQSGDEELARVTLDAAHKVDPFDVETTNYLRLLDMMNGYEHKESAHFIVVYDKQNDPLIGEYFNDYMESIYPAITGEYHTEPKVKTIIEVFPTHDAFSVRTTGSPWIGTVGASTGRIIALTTPRKGEGTWKAFNWAQVLRHEFTHTVTLAATDNRISHWMTEGLAVYEEHSPLQWAWVPMVYHAVMHNELFDMDQLTWMFVRPKKPADRQMAYAESFWVCTYIENTYGHEAILKMLAEFKNGGLQEDVFPKILGRSQDQFFSDFKGWAAQQVATWGYDDASTKKYDEWVDKGDSLINTQHYGDAVKVWEEIGKLRPMDEQPHKRLAGLYMLPQVNQPEKAIEHLKVLHLLDVRDNRYAKRVSGLYFDLGDYTNAEAWGLQAVYIDPYDMVAHRQLEKACEKADDKPGLERERRVIPELQAWLDSQKKP
jgi:tetratricopeptide (TPR) repeat protein